VAVFEALVTWIEHGVGARVFGHNDAGASVDTRNPALALPELVDTVGFNDSVNVTPDGRLLNVSLICDEFTVLTAAPFVKFCEALRHAPAKPPVITKEAVPFATLRFVKIAAVPWLDEDGLPLRAPTAMLPILAPLAVMTFWEPVVVSR
jgi:hypothetical protein